MMDARKHSEKLIANCPVCGKNVPYRSGDTSRYFPFCSCRCKMIDLGKWLDEEHRIEEPLTDVDPLPSRDTGD